jgi:NADH:ubiquinone oxidoreductase subunit K
VKKLEKDEIYERWEKELDVTKDLPFANADNYRNLIVMLQTCEIMLASMDKRKFKNQDQMRMISRFVIAHVYQLGCSIFQLTKTGYGNPALIICRSMLESLIDLSYLWLCKDINGDDIERNAWAEYYKLTRYSVYTHWEAHKKRQVAKGKPSDELFNESSIERLDRDFKEFEQRYPYTKSRGWAKVSPLVKRAQALDDTQKVQTGFPNKGIIGFPDFSFEAEYVTIYKHTSEFAHGESGLIQTLFETEGNVGTIIIGVSDHENTTVAIGLSANYILMFMYIFVHLNGLNLNFIPEELERHGFVVPTQE